jgi:hypothetical protein
MKTKFTPIFSVIVLLFAAFASPVLAAPALAAGSSSASISATSYSPQPTDISLTRDKVSINLAKSYLIVSPGSPVKVSAFLTGYLPDPCHVLRIVVGAASASSNISIQAYSLFKAGTACATVIQPFSVTVPLGSFSSGQYTVLVNGLKLGSFSATAVTTASSSK